MGREREGITKPPIDVGEVGVGGAAPDSTHDQTDTQNTNTRVYLALRPEALRCLGVKSQRDALKKWE